MTNFATRIKKEQIEANDASDELLNSITHGTIKIKDSIRLIKDFLEEEPSQEYSLVIGTDSHEKENNSHCLPDARDGRGVAGAVCRAAAGPAADQSSQFFDRAFHLLDLGADFLGSGSRFLGVCGVLLDHALHLGNGLVDLMDAGRLFAGGSGDFGH